MDVRLASLMQLSLPSDRELVFRREFEAARRLVFEAWTDPEHMVHWFGCHHSTLVACEVDLRVHGAYRFVTRGPDGADHTLTGFYCEIVRPERLVYTETYFGPVCRSSEALITVTFAERQGVTTLTCKILHKTAADRDQRVRTGFENGMAESLDRLAERLATMS